MQLSDKVKYGHVKNFSFLSEVKVDSSQSGRMHVLLILCDAVI